MWVRLENQFFNPVLTFKRSVFFDFNTCLYYHLFPVHFFTEWQEFSASFNSTIFTHSERRMEREKRCRRERERGERERKGMREGERGRERERERERPRLFQSSQLIWRWRDIWNWIKRTKKWFQLILESFIDKSLRRVFLQSKYGKKVKLWSGKRYLSKSIWVTHWSQPGMDA